MIIGCKNTIADGIGDYPAPENGDWVISSYTKVWNETINLTGNLTMKNNGKLIFNNVTLLMNCRKNGEFSIDVENGGEFYIYDNDENSITTKDSSIITVNNSNFIFYIRNGATFEIINSELNYCGYDESNPGLILESNDVKIVNCVFYDNYYGIFCKSSEPEIRNCVFDSNSVGIGFSDSNIEIINSTIINSKNFDFSLDSNSQIILLNTTFDKIKEIDFKDDNSQISVKWFLGIKVTDQEGKPIQKSNIRIQDNENGTFDKNYFSNKDGNVLWILCNEYIESVTLKKYFTPYGITATKNNVINHIEAMLIESELLVIDLLIFNENWIVDSLETYTNVTIILNANLSIENNGNLKFNNVELIINCNFDGDFYVEVKNGGKFYINDNDNNKATTNDATLIRSDQEDFEYLIYIREGAFFELKNSKLQDCGYDNSNPGLIINSDDVLIENNTLSNNFYGIYCNNANPTIKSNIIMNNEVYGIFCEQSASKIINNEISNNIYGINITINSAGIIEKNKIFENDEHGIICYQNSKPVIFDNQIYENGKDGISTYFISNALTIINSTLTDNERNGVYAKNSRITIDNSTITGSINYDFYLIDSSFIDVINSTFRKQNVDVIDELSNLSIYWFAFIRVTDEDNIRIISANLRIMDNENGDFDKNYTTDNNGSIRWIKCLEYIQNNQEKKYFTPHFINATYNDKYGTLTYDINYFIIMNVIIPLKDYTPPKILNYDVINITQTSATIRWTTNELSDSLLKYINDTFSLPLIEWDWEYMDNYTLNHEFNLKDLGPETSYYFHINSTDLNGNTIESKRYEFTTLTIPEPKLEVEIEFLDEYFISNTSGYDINIRVSSESKKIGGANIEYGSIINEKIEKINKDSIKTDNNGFRQVIYNVPYFEEDILLTIWVNVSADGYEFNNDTTEDIWVKVIKVSKILLQESLPNNTKVTVMAGYIGDGVLNGSSINNPGVNDYKNLDVFFDVNFTGENFFWFNITIKYDENLLPANIKEYNLRLYQWNVTNESWQWEIVQKGGVNENNNYVWANLTHLTIFAPRDEEAKPIVEPPPKYPDLNLIKIEFSNNKPNDGEVITINVTIRNDGKSNTSNFKVKFYVDNNEIGESEIKSLNIKETTIVSTKWTTTKGEHNIIAKLENVENDSDTTNNEISKLLKSSEKEGEGDGGGVNIIIIILPIIGIVMVVIYLLFFKFDILGRNEVDEEDEEEDEDEGEEDEEEIDDEEIEDEDESEDEDIDEEVDEDDE